MIHYTATDTTDETIELLEESDLHIDAVKKKSLAGVVSFLMRGAFLQIIGLVAAALLSAFFEARDFGIYGFVTQIIGLLVFFSDVGLAATLIQKKTDPTTQEYRVAFTIQQLLAWFIVLLSMVAIASGFVSAKTGMVGVWVLVSLAISFPIVSLKTVSSIQLERKLEFSKLVLPQIIEQLVFYGVLVGLAWKGMGALAYAYATILRSVVGVVVMWFMKPWPIGFAWDRAIIKQMVGFGVQFQLFDLLARFKDNLFYLVLGFVMPLHEFGYINWAKNWSMYPYNLTVGNVSAVMFPTYSRLQGHHQVLKRAIEKTAYFISLFIVPLIIGMVTLIGPITVLVSHYAKWQPALFSFTLFALSIIPSAISSPLVSTLNALGEIKQSLKLMGMWLSLTWIVTPLLLWKFGFDGVAMASLVIALTSIVPIYFVKRIIPIALFDQVWRSLAAGLLMGGVGFGLQQWLASGWTAFLVGTLLLGLSYVLTILVIDFSHLRSEVVPLVERIWKRS